MANSSINLTGLDFDAHKASLKSFLKSQDRFRDYDFDGSNMSVLLDVLSYNTYLNLFYHNMAINEWYLDSSQLRNSQVSLAKSLNYTPRSSKSSVATISISFPQSNLNVLTIPSGTRFSGRNTNGTFSFVTDTSTTLYPVNGLFSTSNLVIKDGRNVTENYVVNYGIEDQRFVMSNPGIDTDSLVVSVSEDGNNFVTFEESNDIFYLDANSSVYFVQASEDQKYEVVFGDGVLGKRPKDGSIIRCDYRVSAGASSNYCSGFNLDTNIGSFNGLTNSIPATIVTIDKSTGGGDQESSSSIKMRAPQAYQTQRSAVTASDYEYLILKNFQNIRDIHVYGGEDVTDTPSYGVVFISAISMTGDPLTDTMKDSIKSFIADKMISFKVELVDAQDLYIVPNIIVEFAETSSLKPADIESAVNDTVQNFVDDNLLKFNVNFIKSKFTDAIDNTNKSIIGSDVSLRLKKVIDVITNQSNQLSLKFNNPIVHGSVVSESFYIGSKRYQIVDYNPFAGTFIIGNNNGEVSIRNASNVLYLKDITSSSTESYTQIGTVDYGTGGITINAITPTSTADNSTLSFYVVPTENFIKAFGNDVLTIDTSEMSVEARISSND